MSNALFAFETPKAARDAVQALTAVGVPSGAVQLHAHEYGPHEKGLETADEIVTGGLLHNLVDLFQGVFEWGGSPHDAVPFEETVRRGGAVVSIDTRRMRSSRRPPTA
ncbi:MAG: hypothetical protein ABIV63_09180 [Caldimonas sp.]